MKSKLFLLLLFISTTSFFQEGNCPAIGDATHEKLQALNRLKNRSVIAPERINTEVTLAELYNSGDDPNKFSEHDAVTLIGYLLNAKQEKGESCNCHTTDVNEQDIHIYMSPNENAATIADCVVVEITGKGKEAHPEWTAAFIKEMRGHKVSVTGYLMYDFEHISQSFDTHPDAERIYRHTVWEIHPITDIHVIE